MSVQTLSTSSAERTSTDDRSSDASSSTVLPEPPLVQISKLHIKAQKEYITHIGIHAAELAAYYDRMYHNHQHRHEKLLLLIQIESTQYKYLPRKAGKGMRWKWWKRRVRLKMVYFWRYEFAKYLQLVERVLAVWILLSGWGVLGKHIADRAIPFG